MVTAHIEDEDDEILLMGGNRFLVMGLYRFGRIRLWFGKLALAGASGAYSYEEEINLFDFRFYGDMTVGAANDGSEIQVILLDMAEILEDQRGESLKVGRLVASPRYPTEAEQEEISLMLYSRGLFNFRFGDAGLYRKRTWR